MLAMMMALIDDESDKEKFERLYNKYCGKMLGLAYTILHSRSLAEEAVSEAFLNTAKCFQKIHNLNLRDLEAYLVITVRNTSINILKKEKRSFAVEELFDSAQLDFEKSIYRADESRLDEALKCLDTRLQAVIAYKYYYGYSIKEIADIMGVSKRTVDNLIARAKAMLLKELEGDI